MKIITQYVLSILSLLLFSSAQAATGKPNILVIWGDDIGQSNISAYTDGLMGYTTPNIDRIANEGMKFTDYYGEQSCTAGRNAKEGQQGKQDGEVIFVQRLSWRA